MRYVLEEAHEVAFPTSSQVMLLVLAWRTTAQGKESCKCTSPYLNHKYLLMGLLSVCKSLIFVGFFFVCLFAVSSG